MKDNIYKFALYLIIITIVVVTIIVLIYRETFLNLNKTFVHPPWMITDLTYDSAKIIINKIIDRVNNITQSKYYLLNIENISNYPYPNATPRLPNCKMVPQQVIIDFFVHDTENKITKRLIAKLKVCPCTLKITVQSINVSNGKDLNTEWKLPTQEFDPYLILTDETTRKIQTNFMKGVEDINFDYEPYSEEPKGRKIPLLGEYQSNILPPQIINSVGDPIANFPCRRQYKCFDNNGIHYLQSGNQVCQGINNSPNQKYPVIYDNPSFLKGVTMDGDKQSYISLMGAQNTSYANYGLTY